MSSSSRRCSSKTVSLAETGIRQSDVYSVQHQSLDLRQGQADLLSVVLDREGRMRNFKASVVHLRCNLKVARTTEHEFGQSIVIQI